LKAQEAAIHAQVLAALHAPAPPNLKPGIPSFIPKSSLKVNRILTAAPGHPALSIGGDSIWLDLPSGRSLATVQGPYLPPGVSGTAVPQTSTTIRVTFARARGSVPLASADFSIIDELGVLHFPAISVLGGGTLPTAVPAGRTRTVLPVGNGTVQYSPAGLRGLKLRSRPLAAWDFSVETD
jgi:hypothetical protein